ncbi:MAG TPA: hypothetical protein PKV21_07365, partial [bacterium]|nr:hypothetical protein [bacterium]
MNKLKLGLIVSSGNLEESFKKVKSFNLSLCQIGFLSEEINRFDPYKIKKKAENYEVEIFSVFMLFKGQIFNNKDGPETMGFIAPKYREERLKLAFDFSDFVKEIGVKNIVCHVGFIPDDEEDPIYKSFLPVMKAVVEKCKENNQIFCFETGQELPSTLKRTILDMRMDNVGIN